MRLWTSLSTSVRSGRNPLHLFATESLRARTSQVSLSCVLVISKAAAAALNEGALRQKIHGDGSCLDHQPARRGQKYVFCDHIVPEYNIIEHGKLLYSDSVIHIVSEMSQRLWHSTILWRKREPAGCLSSVGLFARHNLLLNTSVSQVQLRIDSKRKSTNCGVDRRKDRASFDCLCAS